MKIVDDKYYTITLIMCLSIVRVDDNHGV